MFLKLKRRPVMVFDFSFVYPTLIMFCVKVMIISIFVMADCFNNLNIKYFYFLMIINVELRLPYSI